MTRTNHTRTIGIIIVISVSLVALGPVTFSSQAAQAQGNPFLDAVSGSGTGQIVCPDGQSFSARIGFFVEEQPNGEVAGGAGISMGSGLPTLISISVTDAHVTPSRFTIQGTETIDNLCGGISGNNFIPISIRGECDDSSTIRFSAENGQRGTFIGQVDCARLSN
jgi:hypothetical protein